VILDSSAIVSILLKEPGCEALVEKLAAAPTAGVAAPTLTETGIVLTSRLGADAKRILSLFLAETEIAVIAFGDAHWRAAVDAYRRFGKGRHKARLNFGDCMAYAAARLARQPILCTGADFGKTDLETA